MVNITDEDIWNAEPALRPEDEIVLRKLHDMLQSTADDLKLLSGELSKYHEPGVQVKSLPTPLDEDFNEKVHIEELVNAKFHGYKIVDKSQPAPVNAQRDKIDRIIKPTPSVNHKAKKVIDAGMQVNQVSTLQKRVRSNNLSVSRLKGIQINDNHAISGNGECEGQQKEKTNKPTVAYKEVSFKYVEPNVKMKCPKPLQVQNMPSINIRGELKQQKVLQLNIEPNSTNNNENDVKKTNIAVISVQYKPVSISKTVPNTNHVQYPPVSAATYGREPIRKFSKMSSGESSELDSNNKVYLANHGFRKVRPYRATKMVVKLPSRQHSEDLKNKKSKISKKESAKHSNSNLDAWKKKLNAVYGCPTSSRKSKVGKAVTKKTETKPKSPSCSQPLKNSNMLNNAEYIPYSRLTLGGARISDIEKELSHIPNKTNITLDPILDKILSRENSFNKESPKEHADEENPKILTTSDENLLREVLDIERKVTKTLTKDFDVPDTSFNKDQLLNMDGQDSYADDFEEERSDNSAPHSDKQDQPSDDAYSGEMILGKSHESDSDNEFLKSGHSKINIQNKTFTKTANLSFKENVDIFEFVPKIQTQDIGTQSNTIRKISLKETQTSPRNDKCNVQPIHNDLWPSIDPKGEVENLFKLEKDFIKKLIVDEYADLLEKNLSKPSTSKDNGSNEEKNVTASQKNTQTSPAHVKSVMTSPTRTKTRTTSPITLSMRVNRQTSPITEELKVTVDDGDDLGLSINLSSPRFNLRLPQTSREVMSNLESHSQSLQNATRNVDSREIRLIRKTGVSSSSSADGDYSSSDISSLGEVRFKLKRFQKLHVPNLSELSSSSSVSKYSSDISEAIIPLRSEGEVSSGQARRRNSNNNIKSEGEASLRYQY